MKDTSFALFLFASILSGCGQPGPLYLPTDKPPIYVEPDTEPEAKQVKEPEAKKIEQPKLKLPTTPESKQEVAPKPELSTTPEPKPENLPQPDIKPPAIGQ